MRDLKQFKFKRFRTKQEYKFSGSVCLKCLTVECLLQRDYPNDNIVKFFEPLEQIESQNKKNEIAFTYN
ncbi:hypothetical protein BpHYR1_023492 [Brachionus plicatilis]|uniref:Uncharacterized protein n=1 Tax=Brachionus plicatilis TaxID=10195 RepID=A0A3M7SDX9_BRAPC|nr:hypothetical protein BpHYR1_023492 [Brachionus plicatilis]